MLLHYIELISEYQDTRRSQDVGAPSSDTDTPQQDTPDMPPPPELVQSIKSAGGDLPACDAVTNEDDIASFGDILDKLNRQDEFPDPNLSFHPLPHGAHTEAPYSATRPRGHRFQPGMAGHDNPQLGLIGR